MVFGEGNGGAPRHGSPVEEGNVRYLGGADGGLRILAESCRKTAVLGVETAKTVIAGPKIKIARASAECGGFFEVGTLDFVGRLLDVNVGVLREATRGGE